MRPADPDLRLRLAHGALIAVLSLGAGLMGLSLLRTWLQPCETCVDDAGPLFAVFVIPLFLVWTLLLFAQLTLAFGPAATSSSAGVSILAACDGFWFVAAVSLLAMVWDVQPVDDGLRAYGLAVAGLSIVAFGTCLGVLRRRAVHK